MENSNYNKIFTGSFITIQRVIADLKKQNINAVVKDENESARLAGFGYPVYGELDVYVHKDEIDTALEIMKNINDELVS